MVKTIFTPEINDYIRENIDKVKYKDMVIEIQEKFGRTFTAKQLGGRANNMGLKQFTSKEYDRNFFKEINTTEKAYWLGFIYADGWICQTKINAELGIELASVDEAHLYKFRNALKANTTEIITSWKPEKYIKSMNRTIRASETSKIRLYSKDLVNGLISHGVSLRKTYSAISPDFKYSEEINLALLRGYFDGDGGLDKNGKIHFTAYSDVFLKKVAAFLKTLGVETYEIYYEREGKARLMVKEKSSLLFLSIIYEDTNYSFLDRKYFLYQSLKNNLI